MARLSCLLEAAIRHSMWDAMLEFRLLPAPLCLQSGEEGRPAGMGASPSPPATNILTSSDLEQSAERLSLKNLSQEAAGTGAAGGNSKTAEQVHDIPDIVVDDRETKEAMEEGEAENATPDRSSTTTFISPPLVSPYDTGDRGRLAPIYEQTLFDWLELGGGIEVPSYNRHYVRLESKHEMGVLLKELGNLVTTTVTDLDVKLFRKGAAAADGCCYWPSSGGRAATGSDQFLMVGRNIELWSKIVQEKFLSSFIKKFFFLIVSFSCEKNI